jgi:hypothetical protein
VPALFAATRRKRFVLAADLFNTNTSKEFIAYTNMENNNNKEDVAWCCISMSHCWKVSVWSAAYIVTGQKSAKRGHFVVLEVKVGQHQHILFKACKHPLRDSSANTVPI